MKKKVIMTRKLLVVGLLALLTACSNSDLGSGGDGLGSLTLGVTDAPIDDALKVVVEFTGATLKGQGENGNLTDIEFDEPKVIDLLSLQGSANEIILDDVTVPAGSYQWIRLNVVADGTYNEPAPGDLDGHGVGSYLLQDDGSIDGLKIPLRVPSGSHSGLKLVSGFTVNDSGQTQFTIDFDLRKAVHDPLGKSYFELRPALRLIENKNAGHIAGFIDPDVHLVDASCPNVPDELEGVAVYLFEAGSPVEDLQITEGVGPVSTALVTYENEAYQYAFGFLDAGEYVLVLTCDAELDDLEADDDIVFISTIEQVYVEAKITTWVDFD